MYFPFRLTVATHAESKSLATSTSETIDTLTAFALVANVALVSPGATCALVTFVSCLYGGHCTDYSAEREVRFGKGRERPSHAGWRGEEGT